jgi:uncharacterized membrane protein YqiK
MSDMYGVPRRRLVGEAWFWIAMIFAAVLLIIVAIWGIRWISAEPRGALSARESIQSGGSRITSYNHFFDLCASVQAIVRRAGHSGG